MADCASTSVASAEEEVAPKCIQHIRFVYPVKQHKWGMRGGCWMQRQIGGELSEIWGRFEERHEWNKT